MKKGWKRTNENYLTGVGIMMNDYDEYQKMMRYKCGYYSFMLLLVLLMFDFILNDFWSYQWAETQGLETLFIMGLILLIFNGFTIYHNAHFSRKENAKWYLLLDILTGIIYTTMFFPIPTSNPKNLLINGKLTYSSFFILIGLTFFIRPVVYIIRKGLEKLKDK